MSSASEKLLAEMRVKREAMCTYKALYSLPKGQMFTISKFDYQQSIYENADKKKPYVLVPHFSYGGINMKTYFPGEFTDVDEQVIIKMRDTFNADIANKVKIKFAYYGNMAQQNIVKLHFNDEDIDEEKLKEVEEWQKKTGDGGSPFSPSLKRQRNESDSPVKTPGSAKKRLQDQFD